ncbi:hypothetical protein LJR231_003484 [Phyllobacterium sp. LjRoot231]|uniref:hypothetical protein n=1 Tax=Phyllobacterium sp. LjRoot231 TaxID=3342289 RepID=UPI003ED0EF0A
MRTFHTIAAQGELRFVRTDEAIPANAITVEPVNDKVIVGHSETGHHHIMDAGCVTMHRLPDSIMDCLLVVTDTTALEHLRTFDTHEPLIFEKGTYRVTTAREHTPEGWRKTID